MSEVNNIECAGFFETVIYAGSGNSAAQTFQNKMHSGSVTLCSWHQLFLLVIHLISNVNWSQQFQLSARFFDELFNTSRERLACQDSWRCARSLEECQ